MELPTLENTLKILARSKIESRIRDLHILIYGDGENDAFFSLLKGVKICVRFGEIEKTIDLSLLFNDLAINRIIIEERLAEYLEKEIKAVICNTIIKESIKSTKK